MVEPDNDWRAALKQQPSNLEVVILPEVKGRRGMRPNMTIGEVATEGTEMILCSNVT